MDNDGSYKRIFSEPQMVRDLLTGFIRQDWVKDVDFSTLTRIKSDHISDNWDRRFNDTVWKVRLHESWMYVCIMLEFQSRPDKFMPVRIMTYLGLLYEDIARSGELLPTGKLPPVLPVVLYNGQPKWRYSTEIFDLIAHISDDFENYMPKLSFMLIDESQFFEDGKITQKMRETQNLVAALFALENAVEKRAILNVVNEMLQWLKLPEQQSLSRALAGWFDRVLRPSKKETGELPAFEDLTEVSTMLRETVQGWYEEAERKGRAAGMEKGMEKGMEHRSVQIARMMKENGESIEKIERYTGLTAEEITQL